MSHGRCRPRLNTVRALGKRDASVGACGPARDHEPPIPAARLGSASSFLSRISGWRDRRLYPLAWGARGIGRALGVVPALMVCPIDGGAGAELPERARPADRPALAGWAALRLLADVDISF